MDFGVEHGDGGRTGVAGVVELVAAGSPSDSVGFWFLEANTAHKVCIGDFAVRWDLLPFNEENGARALDLFWRGGRVVLMP
jgi:hypothetical protein